MPSTKPSKTTAVPPTPDIDTVEDGGPAGTDGYPIQVRVVGAVYTHEMPAANSSDGNVNASNTETQLLFAADPRRKEVTFWCEDSSIYFGRVMNMVQTGTSAHLPAGGSATIRHRDAIYVRGDTGTARVSYVLEQWAD